MPSIMFWNVAGAGTGDEGENLSQTLEAYTALCHERFKVLPDCVVICEVRKVSKVQKAIFEFGDYKYVKPDRRGGPQFYHGDDDKRLYVFAKPPGGQAWQFTSGASRPSVLVAVGTKRIMVMHAPSVTATSKPQGAEMKASYDLADAGGLAPDAIFGDLNVDRMSKKRVASLDKSLAGHTLDDWVVFRTGVATHKNRSELDWALCDPMFKPDIRIVAPGGKRKRRDDDDDYVGDSSALTKRSDHKPLLLSW